MNLYSTNAFSASPGTILDMFNSHRFSASNPGSQISPDLDQSLDVLEPFVVLLFDDPVNTMQYVAAALREVLKVDGPTAESLMMEAHTTGKAAVFTGPRQDAEQVCTKLHAWTLHATVAK